MRKRFGTPAGERVEPVEPEYTGVIAAGYKSRHLQHRPEPVEPASPGLVSIECEMPEGVQLRGSIFQMTITDRNRDAVEDYFNNLLGPPPHDGPWVITQEMQTAKPLPCGHHQCDGCTCAR